MERCCQSAAAQLLAWQVLSKLLSKLDWKNCVLHHVVLLLGKPLAVTLDQRCKLYSIVEYVPKHKATVMI